MRTYALFAMGLLLTLSACSWHQQAGAPFVGPAFVVPPFIFKFPAETLDGAKVVSPGGTGLAIVRGDSYIAIDTVTGDAIGYPDLDMRTYPKIIWGREDQIDPPPGLREEIESVRRLYAANHPQMEMPIRLNRGVAWFAHGSDETVTLLAHENYAGILVRVYTRKVPVEVVREKIIGSASAVTRR